LKRLVAYDVHQPDVVIPIDRLLPLGGDQWAVGRRLGDTAVWRIVEPSTLGEARNPAWLWTEDAWFDPSSPDRLDGPEPEVEPLRALMRYAASLGGSRKHTIRALAAAVAGIRRQKRSVAVTVPAAALESSSTPARYFALALLTALPESVRLRLRMSIGDPNPDPRLVDIAITASRPEGFRIVDVLDPPDEGRDLVAYYLRNRMSANDPEAVETAAELYDGPADQDTWGEGIRKLIRSGVPGVSSVSEEMIERDPNGAMRAIRARLRAGASLDDDVVDSLVTLTVVHGDHRAWRPLVIRPVAERARTVSALLDRASEITPCKELLEVLGAIQPRGAAFADWCQLLVTWMASPDCTATAQQILREALLDWPMTESTVSRVDLWCDAIRALVRTRDFDGAQALMHDELSFELAAEGHGADLVSLWEEVPPQRRTLDHLASLFDVVDASEDRDVAIPAMVRAASATAEEMRAVLRRWPDLAVTPPPVFREAEGVGRSAEPRDLASLARTLTDPRDSRWIDVELGQARQYQDGRSRFVALANLERGLQALEPTALALCMPAMEATTFPDPGIADVALRMLELEHRSAVWPWVALMAAEPARFDEGTIDATVVQFLGQPSDSDLEIDVAHAATRALGLGGVWQPLEHARWLARIVLAPDIGIGLNEGLALTLIRSVAHRPDAIARISAITTAFLELPPDHLAVQIYAARLLPDTWLGGPPPELAQSIEPWRLRGLPPVWARVLGR
jgi:hypothetical protein